MLSTKYQIFLILLLRKPVTKSDVRIFSTKKSFYTMTAFLQDRELIQSKVVDGKGTKMYSLTQRGEIISLILEDIMTKHEREYVKSYIVGDAK